MNPQNEYLSHPKVREKKSWNTDRELLDQPIEWQKSLFSKQRFNASSSQNKQWKEVQATVFGGGGKEQASKIQSQAAASPKIPASIRELRVHR